MTLRMDEEGKCACWRTLDLEEDLQGMADSGTNRT